MRKSPDVDAWLSTYENPMKPVVIAMRDLILSEVPQVQDCLKWSAPTFIYKGNIASFFPRSKAHASLMFHKGAEIEGDFPNLLGAGKDARSFKVATVAELGSKSDELIAIFNAWCAQKNT